MGKKKLGTLCASMALASACMMGVSWEEAQVAEAAWTVAEAEQSHSYQTLNEQQQLLMLSIKKGDIETVRMVLADGTVDINGIYKFDWNCGVTPLGYAIALNKAQIIPLLLDAGADVHGYDTFEGQRLDYLVMALRNGGGLELVKTLLAKGADINGIHTPQDGLHGNALTYIVWNGDQGTGVDIATYLLDQGINTEVKDKDGDTPFIDAVKRNWYEMMDLLAARGADVTVKDHNGRTAIDIALQKEDLNLYKHVKVLMEKGTQTASAQPVTVLKTPTMATVPVAATPVVVASTTSSDGSVTMGNDTQSNDTVRNTSLTRFARLCTPYEDAADAAFEALNVGMPDVLGSDATKKAAAIQSMREQAEKIRTQMAALENVDPLQDVQGFDESEMQLFTEGFGSIYTTDQALADALSYVVAHPDNADHDTLVTKIKAVFYAKDAQKSKMQAVQNLYKDTVK